MLLEVFKQGPQHILGLALLPLGGGIGVHAGEHKVLQRQHGLGHRRGLSDFRLARAGLDGVPHQRVDPRPVGKAQHLAGLQGDVHGIENAAPQGVLDVVVDIGDVVGQPDHLALQRGSGGAARVAEDAVAHLPGQVQSLAVFLQPLHHPHRLAEVGKAPGHQLVEHPLPGVAEGGVAQIVAQGDGLGQVLVQGQGPGDGPGDTIDLQGVGHAGAVVVSLGQEEHLGLVL